MRLKTSLSTTVALAVLLGVSSPVGAGQVVKFKTGFELVAERVRYEGKMVILTLDGGSEVGFPNWVIEDVKRDDGAVPAWSNPDGWDSNRTSTTMMSRHIVNFTEPGKPAPAGMKPFTMGSGAERIGPEGISIGFSVGSRPSMFTGAAEGPVTTEGKVGRSLQDMHAEQKNKQFRKPILMAPPGAKGHQ